MQDVWRVTPTITLNLGLRYFIASPPWEQDGQQVVPNPGMSEWFGCRQEAMLAGLPSLDTCGLVEMVLGGKANNAPGFYDWDKNNFSPRIGLAWAPRNLGWFSGNGKMTIRVGYSLVYDRIGNALAVSFDQRGAFGMSTSIADSLGSCAIFSERGRPPCARFTGHGDTAAAGATLDQFGNPLLAVSPGGGFPTTPPFPLISVTGTIDDGLRTPYSHAATVSIARELPGNLIVEVAYVGRRGINLPIQRDFAMGADLRASGTTAFAASQQLIGLAEQGQDILTLGPIPFWENLFPGFGPTGVNGGCLSRDVFGVDPAGNCGFSATQVAFDTMLGWHGTLGPGGVANPGFGAISFFLDDVDFSGLPSYATCPNGTDVDNDGLPDCPFTFFPGQWVALNGWTGLARSEYHALQVSVRKRMSHGLLFNINYTFSHSLDHASIPERTDLTGGSEIGAGPSGLMSNAWELDQQYGDSDFDMRHQLNAHWAYELPIGSGRAWSGVALIINQITGMLVGGAPEKIVEPHIVQGRRRRKTRDVPAKIPRALVSAHNGRQCIPANQRKDAPLHEQITRHNRFLAGRYGVSIRGGNGVGQSGAGARHPGRHSLQKEVGAIHAAVFQNVLQRVHPLFGLYGIFVPKIPGVGHSRSCFAQFIRCSATAWRHRERRFPHPIPEASRP